MIVSNCGVLIYVGGIRERATLSKLNIRRVQREAAPTGCIT